MNVTPNHDLRRVSWSIVSKATEKSSKTRAVGSPHDSERWISFLICSNAVSVDWKVLYLECWGLSRLSVSEKRLKSYIFKKASQFSIYSIWHLRGVRLVNGYRMMTFKIGFWCCASESALQRLSHIKPQNRKELLLLHELFDNYPLCQFR